MTVAKAGSESNAVRAPNLARRNARLLLGGAVMVAAIAYLILAATRGSTAYYLTITELRKQGFSASHVRVVGMIVGDSIVWDARNLELTFDIADPGGILHVVYHGARPDMFRDGAEVVVEGQYTAPGKMEARQLLLKCPSKYEEKR
jgi:cytochrome c-type biogenesis protein CcmE